MYNILSLDGGGSWAILQLLTLKERYPGRTGHEILREYDLVIANSGGSIILAALAENWSLDKALTLFQDQEVRESIFSKNSFKERFFPIDYIRLVTPFGPKYSTKRKGEALQRIFPEINKRQMHEVPEFIGKPDLKLVVCTYDALNNRAKFFRSFGEEDPMFDSVRLTQAIHGSSNAPIQYFDFPARFKAQQSGIYYELWDGGLGGFNNPVAAGIIEALKLGESKSDIHVVSIGTGNKLMSYEDKVKFWNNKKTTQEKRSKKLNIPKLKPQLSYFFTSVLNQAKTILYQPPDWANYLSQFLLFERVDQQDSMRLIRLSPMIHKEESTKKETAELLDRLYELDMDLTSDEDIALITTCFENWRAGKIKNQPVEFRVSRNNDLLHLKGQATFQEAMELWRKNPDLSIEDQTA